MLGADDIDETYCKKWCGSGGCAQCPAPTLYDENEPAFNLFMRNQTQFNTVFNGSTVIQTGLNYQAVQASAQMMGVDMSGELFADLQRLERAYLDVISEKVAHGNDV